MIQTALLIFGGIMAIGGVMDAQFALPTVYESWETQKCVRVDDPDGRYTCQNLPTKYNHEWIK